MRKNMTLPGGRWAIARRRARTVPPALEWAEDAAGRCARITAVGSKSLLVENHTGILELTDSRVALNTRGGALRVEGNGLTLGDVREGALTVRGDIRRVDLPCGKGGAPDEG